MKNEAHQHDDQFYKYVPLGAHPLLNQRNLAIILHF